MDNQGFRRVLFCCANSCNNCGIRNVCELSTTDTYPISWVCDYWRNEH